jgi:hypothetical protein
MHATDLLSPPPPSARALFPPAFRGFVVFGDLEEEFDWGKPFSREAIATTAVAALPAANRRFVEAGVVPTYVCGYPVAATPESRDAVAAMECDIGAHLHPWVTPPHDEAVSVANSFAGNLPEPLERAKLALLTDTLEAAFGRRPTIYRAGRYGVGPNTHRILADLGYRVDASVRARFDYGAEAGPDFTDHPIDPYWLDNGLLTLPLTTSLAGPLGRWPGLTRVSRLRGALARSGLLNRIPLTPEGVPLAEARQAIETELDRGTRIFSLSFHTPSLVPGHTPYVRDAADLRAFWAWWDGVFDLFARRGVTPVRAPDILAAAKQG